MWRAGKAIAIGIALVSLVGLSSVQCGDEAVTKDNIGQKLTEALCGAAANCCASQGTPLTANDRQLCELTASGVLIHLNDYLFDPAMAAACLKVAQGYKCQDRSTIEAICRQTFYDPALGPSTVPQLGPEGSDCAIRTDCAFYEGLTCVPFNPLNSSYGTCEKLSTTGGTCLGYADCVLGDYCEPTSMICMPNLPDGAACGVNYCNSGVCSNGVCVAGTGCVLR